MFVTSQHFNVLPYQIPNLDEEFVTGFPARVEQLERDCLRKSLGLLLYEEFVSGLATLPATWVLPENVMVGYSKFALVYYNGVIYKSTIDINNTVPGTNGDWVTLSVWDDTTAYLLGDSVMYNDVIITAIVDSIGVAPSDLDQWLPIFEMKWLWLRDGGVKYNTKYIYDGVKSFLIPYIFSYWTSEQYSRLSGIAVVKQKGENSTVISPKRKVVAAFNDAKDKIGDSYYKYNTLWGYLNVNDDLYPDWDFSNIGQLNIMGI